MLILMIANTITNNKDAFASTKPALQQFFASSFRLFCPCEKQAPVPASQRHNSRQIGRLFVPRRIVVPSSASAFLWSRPNERIGARAKAGARFYGVFEHGRDVERKAIGKKNGMRRSYIARTLHCYG